MTIIIMVFENVKIERLFLEAWYSQVDTNPGNDHVDILDTFISLMHPNH